MAVPSEESPEHHPTALEDPQENGAIEESSNDAVEATLEPVASDRDPKHEVPEPESLPSGSNDESTGTGQPELKKDEGSRTFTMRELLGSLKGDQSQSNNSTPVAPDAASPLSEDSSYQNHAAMELINSVTGVDEEGRSRQKILTYAARSLSDLICPEALELLPEGPNSGHLVLQGQKTITTSFSCFFKKTKTINNWLIKDLPFPQNKRLSIIGSGHNHSIHDVYLIPVINQPLSSNRYYAIKAGGRRRGEAYTSSVKEDLCCFSCIMDLNPTRPFDQDDKCQQFEFSVTESDYGTYMPTAKPVAGDGCLPPRILYLRLNMESNTPENFHIGEAQGIDTSLRAHLPDFNILSHQERSKSIVVGKWYCPFMFIKDGKRKTQIKESAFYKMTLEQRWERVFAAERGYNQGKKVTIDVIVPTETVKIAGQEAAQEDRENNTKVVWYKSTDESGIEVFVGLSTLIVERIMWEEEQIGWIKAKDQRVRLVKEEIYEGIGDWKSFGCYVLVETFVLRRNNGRNLLTYDFRHTHQIRSKWE